MKRKTILGALLLVTIAMTGCAGKTDAPASVSTSTSVEVSTPIETQRVEDKTADSAPVKQEAEPEVTKDSEGESTEVHEQSKIVYERAYESESKEGAKIKISATKLLDESGKYPELAKVLNEFNDKQTKSVDTQYEYSVKSMEEMIKEGDEADYEWYSDADAGITRADDKVFSFVVNGYYYLGGAHPYSDMTGYVINPETGKSYELADFVKDKEGFKKVLSEAISKCEDFDSDYYSADEIADAYINREHEYDGSLKKLQWYVTEEAVKIYVSEMSMYADSDAVISISFEGNEKLFSELALN